MRSRSQIDLQGHRNRLAASREARIGSEWELDRKVEQVRGRAGELARYSDRQLREYVDRFRNADDLVHQPDSIDAIGCLVEGIRRTIGVRLYETQIRAGIIVSHDAVCEMQTGEGKTLALAIPTFLHALSGYGVHVSTANAYLAARDEQLLRPAFAMLGLSTAHLLDTGEDAQPKDLDCRDALYGPGHAFGFNFLSDLRNFDASSGRIAKTRSRHRFAFAGTQQPRLQRRPYAAIVDEIDHVLLDDAVSPLVLNSPHRHEADDAELHHAARRLSLSLSADHHYRILPGPSLRLTERGFQTVYAESPNVSEQAWKLPWHEYVLLALKATLLVKRDVNYVVIDRDVRLVDSMTGRIYRDRAWSDGLQQAVQAKEQLPILNSGRALASTTRQQFYRRYVHLGGATGTALECEHEFKRLYGLPVRKIATRCPSRRKDLPPILTLDRCQKLSSIVEEVRLITNDGRPVLVGTPSVAANREMSNVLRQAGMTHVTLDGLDDTEESLAIAAAGKCRCVTVATQIAGRGTDIRIDPDGIRCGGLHVIIMQPGRSARIDRQWAGRAGRSGEPGSSRMYLSADDPMISDAAPWIGRAIRRAIANANSEMPSPTRHAATADASIVRSLGKAQAMLERKAAQQRARLFRSDAEFPHASDESFRPSSGYEKLS